MNNTKALCISLVAILAIGAMVASTALADSPHSFVSASANTVLTGANEAGTVHKFTTNTGAATECKKVSFQGSILGATEVDTVTVVPKWEECTFAGNAVIINVVDCAYVFDSDTVGSGGNEHADVDFECAEGGQIEFITSACTLDMRAQTAIKQGVTYTNVTNGDVTVNATTTEVKVAQKTGSPILCAFAGTTGVTTGTFLIGGRQFTSNSGTTTTPVYVEGADVKIEVNNK